MAFEFLPSNPQQETPQPKPNTEEGRGGKISTKGNVFYDNYVSHLDAHYLFSSPPKPEEFNLKVNYDDYVNSKFSDDTIKSRIKSGWYSPNATIEKIKAGYTEFQNPELLNDVLNKLVSEIPSALFSQIEKPKMKINDRFGMFSFDLAAMAMTYVYEYFTTKGNKKVDAAFVEKIKGKFYFTPTKEEVKQVVKKHPNGNPVVVSSVKKSLIDFEKKATQNRAVEIMVLNAYSYTEAPKDIIYNSLAAISVAQNLLLKGFRVKLTSVLAVTHPADRVVYYHFVPAKRFNQPLDINAAAYICGDPVFYRYQGFKMIIWGYDQNHAKMPGGLGTIVDDVREVSKTIEKDYVPNSQLKQADTRLYFGGSRNMAGVKREVEQALSILNEKYSTKN